MHVKLFLRCMDFFKVIFVLLESKCIALWSIFMACVISMMENLLRSL